MNATLKNTFLSTLVIAAVFLTALPHTHAGVSITQVVNDTVACAGSEKSLSFLCLNKTSGSIESDSNSRIKLEKNDKFNLTFGSSQTGVENYEVVVGNTKTNTSRILYKGTRNQIGLVPASTHFLSWSVPRLATDFIKTGNLSTNEIKNSFYIIVNVTKKTGNDRTVLDSSKPIFFSIDTASETAYGTKGGAPQLAVNIN